MAKLAWVVHSIYRWQQQVFLIVQSIGVKTMQELRQSNGFDDLGAKFTFEITRYNGAKSDRDGYIFKDDREGKVYIMQSSAILQSSYSAEETAQRDRLNASKPLKTGDVVIFEGKPHTVKINGDYSDAGVLIPA